MMIAWLKLADIAARSIFLLVVLYALPARASGQFGLALTLIALFAFISGFERYLDLQRVLVGKTARQSDRLILQTLRFFALGYLLWLPPLAASLLLWARVEALQTLLLLSIAVAEHLATEAYRIALISTRHRWLLSINLGKNLLLLAATVVLLHSGAFAVGLDRILMLWAGLSFTAVLIGAASVRRTAAKAPPAPMEPLPALGSQFRRSRTHFVIGLVALASLQLDRLLAGALLPLDQSGIYFRHIFVAAAAYQAFGVISHNRILKRLYGHAVGGNVARARSLVRRELRLYVPLSGLAIASVLAAGASGALSHPTFRSIVPSYLATLMLAYLLRGVSDYNAMLLNAAYRERDIFTSQMIAVIVTFASCLALAPTLGIPGLIAGLLMGACAYLILTFVKVRQLP